MRVLYTKRTRLTEDEEAAMSIEWRDLDGVMAESDYVMLAPTLTADSMSLIRERELSLMKRSAYLINISRGRVVDEEALIQALESGRIAGAGLDVFNDEPPISEPNPDPRLLKMRNVVLTVMPASARWIFDEPPESMWSKLVEIVLMPTA